MKTSDHRLDPLDNEKLYAISGEALNTMFEDGRKNLEEAGRGYDNQLPYNYQEAYWNGFSFAVAGIREMLHSFEIK